MSRRAILWACGLSVGLAVPGAFLAAGWRWAAGVLGGAVLLGASAWLIRDLVEGLMGRAGAELWQTRGDERGGGAARARGAGRTPEAGWLLVKCFTRHAMLGLAAYGMMVRLQFDPVALVVGVSAPVAAVAIDAMSGGHRGS